MRPNRLKDIWNEGGAVINGWLQIPHGIASEAAAEADWDSLTIDLQHGPVGYDNAVPMLQAISTTDKVPLARVPWNEPGIIMKMLDAGAYGIICPMINTAEEAQRFVGACMYPPAPHGYRSFGPNRVRIYAGDDYGEHANDTVLPLAMVETKQSVENLDGILATPGLAGVYVGPADLAQSYGRKPQADHTNPDMVAIIEHIAKTTRAKGLVAGIHVGAPAYGLKMIEAGYNFITISSELRLMTTACQAAVKAIKGGDVKKASGPY